VTTTPSGSSWDGAARGACTSAAARPSTSIGRFDTGAGGDTELEADGGFDFVAGLSSKRGPMLEVRVGSSGSPDLRFAVGYTFGRWGEG
jgi:hypothetical protein